MVEKKLRGLKLLEKNARYMQPDQFQRLVANIRDDGCLTTAPLIHEDRVLSGNHRVQAAIEAGIETADCIEIVSPLTGEQRIAIQLSHNAIEGEDDPNTLRELYESLGFDGKSYSGLTDDMFDKASPVDIASLAIGAPAYQELSVQFLPAEAEQFEAALERIERASKSKRAPVVHVARFEDFDLLFETVIAVKEHTNVHNSAIALRRMAELALERLAELEENDAPRAQAEDRPCPTGA